MVAHSVATALVFLALLVSAAAVTGCLFLRRAQLRWRARCLALEAQLPALRHEMQLVASINARAQRQIKRMDTRLDKRVPDMLAANQSRLADPKKSVHEAIESARHGADSRRLSAQHGLSRAEAELVARLHGRSVAV